MRSTQRLPAFAAALVALNLLVGMLAMIPLVLLVSLLAYAASGPYGPTTNHTYATVFGRPAPLQLDTDEAGLVAIFLMFVALLLGGAFLGGNHALGRLRPGGVPAVAGWVAALAVTLLPWALGMSWWWSSR
ncbi:hypothetical protein F8271_25230 [Micromonospora sp. ALFpr18c]|uniref:hypothetical protein n=1 Tax=unclassified Micromonospora TaxID=2617518 RepID=UPI00124BADA6|nr:MULTISPECIES: hypothetical protein [unclassified Micromonospora]KAB1932597.1 hypothetical protein F8271_25230 [Micromonospora sp. ALFpr18c]MDG4757353.1 hypothetical protein [Micromonospora sp. WMMD710]